jgi:hypothetical protein
MVSMLSGLSMLYLIGGLPETRGESGSYMHSTLVGLDIPRLRVARTRHDRQMSMGDAGPGAVPVWSKVPTAWSHGGETRPRQSPLRGPWTIMQGIGKVWRFVVRGLVEKTHFSALPMNHCQRHMATSPCLAFLGCCMRELSTAGRCLSLTTSIDICVVTGLWY